MRVAIALAAVTRKIVTVIALAVSNQKTSDHFGNALYNRMGK